MRTRALAASTLALSSLMFAACAAPSDDDDATGTTSEALARTGFQAPPPATVKDPPPPTPKPGIVHLTPGQLVNAPPEAPPPYCGATRFDMRRSARACEDLPGAYVDGGATYVPGAGGKFHVGRLLAGTDAPAAIQATACSFTWLPDDCASPDTTKLLVLDDETFTKRPVDCLSDPDACGIASAPAYPHPGVIPHGTGRCDVCGGYAESNHLWVVLPPDVTSFGFMIPGQQYQAVQVPAGSPAVLDVTLSAPVPAPQTIPIF